MINSDYMKKLFTIMMTILLVVCCKEKEKKQQSVETVEPEVTLSGSNTIDVGYAGGNATLSFTCNTEWKVSPMDSWIEVNPSTGAASNTPVTVTVTYESNQSRYSRDGLVYIFAGDLTKTVTLHQAGDTMYGAGPELKSGSTVLATNPNVEKFLTEVSYPDRDWSYSKVLDYYGGFNDKKYNENGEEDPNGVAFNWGNEPNSDQPMSYSIRWAESDLVAGSAMTLVLEDKLGWKAETAIAEGDLYVNITNLVPNDEYTYKVTADKDGKVLAQGNFSTTGHLHQIFFQKSCRNGRDLGGWKTLDGKTVKYRKVYRGGRMQSETVNNAGKKEILAEGIGAQLDLRGSDRLSKAAVDGIAFLAPNIEQGGTTMLKADHEKTKQCFEFVVENVRQGKGVYFHCSLGRDRTGTLDILLLGLLGVREGDIGKAYEVTYFAPVGYSVSSSEKGNNPKPIFKNTRSAWVYSDVVPYFWSLADQTEGKTFADGVEKYLLEVAGVSQKDIDDFRSLMLE